MSAVRSLGTGIEFGRDFDAEVSESGSLDLIGGVDVLGRDLAFGVVAAVRDEGLLGRRLTVDALSDIETAVRRVGQRDSRVSSIVSVDAQRSDSENTRVEIELSIVAETGERGEFVLPL
jgi:hypothetical protein